MLRSFVLETASNPGTGTFQLLGAATGRKTFISEFTSGTVVFYAADNGTAWEEGYGTITAGSPPTLSRTVLRNSLGNTSPVNLTGTVDIYCTVPAERQPYIDGNGNLVVSSARTKVLGSARLHAASAQSIPNSTDTAIVWAMLSDDLGFWSAGQPTRLTVPAGVTRVRVSAQLCFTANATGFRRLFVKKNGVNQGDGIPADSRPSIGAGNATHVNVCGAILPVTAGDYFEVLALQNTGAALSLVSVADNWFSIERAG